MADFRTRTPAIDPMAFANVLQRKAQMEQEQINIEDKRRTDRMKNITDAVIAGQTIASNMMTMAEKRNKMAQEKKEQDAQDKISNLVSQPPAIPTEEPSLNPAENQRRMADLAAERNRSLMQNIATASPKDFNKAMLEQQTPQTVKAGDRFDTVLEIDGKNIPVVVDKRTGDAVAITGEFAGQVIPKEVVQRAIRGYAPQVIEDLEGRKSLVSRGGKVKGVFGEEAAPETGKEKRVQFTPEERRAVIASRVELQNHPYMKKFAGVAPDISLLEELIEENPKGAMGPVQTQISKQVAGEVGRLTDEDISRNVPTPDLVPKVEQWIAKIKDGDFTDITRERYGIILGIVQKKRAEEAGKILDEITKDVAGFDTTNANYDAVRRSIGRGLVDFIDKHKLGNSKDAIDDLFNNPLGE